MGTQGGDMFGQVPGTFESEVERKEREKLLQRRRLAALKLMKRRPSTLFEEESETLG